MCTGSRAVAKPASGWLLRVPDTGAGTRAGYHATDAHGFPCTSLSQSLNK